MQKWYSELQGMSVGDKYLTTNETEITFFFEAVEPFVHVKRQAYEFDYQTPLLVFPTPYCGKKEDSF